MYQSRKDAVNCFCCMWIILKMKLTAGYAVICLSVNFGTLKYVYIIISFGIQLRRFYLSVIGQNVYFTFYVIYFIYDFNYFE